MIALAGLAASLAANWPGHFAPDSLWQLAQGRSGVYDLWHPPVMAWLLGLADRLVAGTPLFIVLDGALFFSALGAFASLTPRPRALGLVLLALTMASPAVLIFQGLVIKDVLFADAAVASFAALAWAGRCWARPGARAGLAGLALGLSALAALARQNGFVVPLCVVVGLAAIVWLRRPADQAHRRALAHALAVGAASLAVVVLVAGAGAYALARHSDGEPQNLNQLKRLQIYDLAGAVHLDPRLDLSLLRRDAPAVERFVRDEAAPRYTPAGADNLETLPGADQLLIPAGDAASRQWRALIAHRPLLYLRVRTGVFWSTLLGRPAEDCPVFFVGVDRGASDLARAAGLGPRLNGKDRWDDRFARAFLGTPVFSHLSYAALLLVLMAMATGELRREPDAGAVAVLAMGVAALAFVGSFLVVANACDYRYLYFLDVAAMAALARQAVRPAFTQTPCENSTENLQDRDV